ncbi:hypothetical protein [Pseudoalteromonas ardens]|uniref:Uncharacterized protein n=1 Tax=Pseudoalteromonas rubra TaxID=43658 RepID=A0A0L0EUX9_9GAMM|nr:hypothetical protein [Pseudoalteromonas sp. R96]KNC67668.1 hypothetical protein AC626_09330 [Pseudoalteromonas rubra]MDK1309819.1 hypothetical protein [Pseudoalteromonas sp. R96]
MFSPLITSLVNVFKPKRWVEQPFEPEVHTELLSAPCVKGPLEKGDTILTLHEAGTLTIGHVQTAPNPGLSANAGCPITHDFSDPVYLSALPN